MALRSEITELLSGFEKRMKFINIVRCLIDYKYPDTIRAMFSSKLVLDNIVLAVLLYIKDRSLGEEQRCTIGDIERFLDELLPILPDADKIDTRVLARHIVIEVLQRGGILAEWLTYNSTNESFEQMPIRLLNEEQGSYHLTDETFDFLFRSKEIESELDYSVTRFRMSEYMKRNNYTEALAASQELVSRIRSMKLSMDDFLLRCREDISKITVDQYDTVITRVRALLEDEYTELEHIQATARERAKKLEEAQESGVADQETAKHRKALLEIIQNISLTIEEQRSLINKKCSLSESYQKLIRDGFRAHSFERLDFEKDILSPLRQEGAPLGDASKFLLFMFAKPEFEKQFSVENFYAPQSSLTEEETEEGMDITAEESEDEKLIERRNVRHQRIVRSFFDFVVDKSSFTAGDFVKSLSLSDLVSYCEENTLPNVLLSLYAMQTLDIEGWKQAEQFAVEPNGEFELAWCLGELPQELLQVRKLAFTKRENVFTVSLEVDGQQRRIDMSDFDVEVVR